MTEPTTPPVQSQTQTSKKGLYIFGALGCLWIAAIFILGAVAIGIYFYSESNDTVSNTNSEYDYLNDNYNYNYNINNGNDNYNVNTNINLNTNTTTEQLLDDDGTSLGFKINDGFVTNDLFAYQVGAYAQGTEVADNEWPGYRFTVDFPEDMLPMDDEADTGSIWVGSDLDNGDFVQVGMMSSTEAEADGTMSWNYFWEMWNDQDVYQYGLQDDLAPYLNSDTDPVFTLTCQDPATGEWQFWINDVTVGKTYTGSCDTKLENSYVFWELTTNKTDKTTLPNFGPLTLKNFEYWDGYAWTPVEHAKTSYSYGRIVDGTVLDQASVCPPYGVMSNVAEKTAQFGSGVGCTAIDARLW